MNEQVKENRSKIDAACSRCFYALDRQKAAVDRFQEERKKIESSPYIQEERERLTNKAAETLLAQSKKEYEEIHSSLESIRAAAGTIAQLSDIGTEFQNTLTIIKTLGKALPVDQRAQLIDPFKGQMRALSLLRAACETVGIDTEHMFKGLIFDSSAKVDGLDELAHRITIQPQGNPLAVVEFASELEGFAEKFGVELTHHFRDLLDTSGALTAAIRTAAGVGTAD